MFKKREEYPNSQDIIRLPEVLLVSYGWENSQNLVETGEEDGW